MMMIHTAVTAKQILKDPTSVAVYIWLNAGGRFSTQAPPV